MKNFNSFIRKLRNEREYSQDYVAMRLGITLSAYSKLERGKTDPTLTRIKQLAEILDFKLEELFESSSPVEKLGTAESEINANHYIYVTRKEFQELNNQLIEIQKQIIDIVNKQRLN